MVNQLFLWAIFNSKLLVYQRVPILAKSWVPSRSWPLRLSASPDQRPSSGICLRGNEKSWAKRRLNHSSSPSNLQVMQLLFPCDPHMIPIWFSYIITILGSKLWSPKICWPIFFVPHWISLWQEGWTHPTDFRKSGGLLMYTYQCWFLIPYESL